MAWTCQTLVPTCQTLVPTYQPPALKYQNWEMIDTTIALNVVF
jgi:hypothetical protein